MVEFTSRLQQDPSSLPRDAKLVSLILQSMDVEDYDPKVLPQLLEFMHRYVLDVLSDAQLFSEHAGKNEIDADDIRLAVESKVSHSFTGVPSREVLTEVAESRNAIPLPLVPEKYGLRLPPEKNSLTGVNFQILPKRPVKRPGQSESPLAIKKTLSAISAPNKLPPTIPSTSNSTSMPIGDTPAPPPIILGMDVGNTQSNTSLQDDENYDDEDENGMES